MPRLTEKEAQIMRLLWEKGPMFVKDMIPCYSEPRPHFNTVSTTVRILEDKGYVAHEAVGNSYRYHAVARPDDFRERSLSQLVRNFFGNSYSSVVSTLAEQEKISVEELRHIIDMMEQRRKEEDNKTTGTIK